MAEGRLNPKAVNQRAVFVSNSVETLLSSIILDLLQAYLITFTSLLDAENW